MQCDGPRLTSSAAALKQSRGCSPRLARARLLVPRLARVQLLAPQPAQPVLATDNRKHFRSFGLPDEIKTDAVAIDLYAVGRYGTGINSASLVPRLIGTAAVEGAKTVRAKLGNDITALLGLVILGGLVLFLLSERGRSLHAKIVKAAHEYGPPLMEWMAEGIAASERVRVCDRACRQAWCPRGACPTSRGWANDDVHRRARGRAAETRLLI